MSNYQNNYAIVYNIYSTGIKLATSIDLVYKIQLNHITSTSAYQVSLLQSVNNHNMSPL